MPRLLRRLTDQITVTWHFTDVQEVRPDLTNTQARQVLRAIKHNHDANIGINWDVIAIVADDLFPLDKFA